MSKHVFINLPVSDLDKSTEFYESLGFKKNPAFSDKNASSMVWSEGITFMLLTHKFYKTFIKDREIANTRTSSSALIALSLESKEEVQIFAETAKKNGGDYYKLDSGIPEKLMFGYEVEDPDGNILEPTWFSDDLAG